MRSGRKADPALYLDKKLVMKQGVQKEGVFELSKGEAYVVRRTQLGLIHLATLAPNDAFGRMPFLDYGHEPHAAAIYGSADMKVKPLDLAALNREYDGLSTTFRNMLEYNATCITVTTRLALDFQKKQQSAKGKPHGNKKQKRESAV
jgi:hypothetical protein